MRNLFSTSALAAILIAGAAVAQTSSPANQQPVGNANEAAQERAQNTPGAKGGTLEDAKGGVGNPAPAQTVGPPNAGPVPVRGDGMELPGASAQTVPAKFSEKKAELAEYSIMGYPLALDDQQKQAIWQAIGGQQAKTTASAEGKTVFAEAGVFLPDNVDAQPLPDQLNTQIPLLRGLKYVKVDDKVLLVAPSNGIVRGVIEK
jgi:hypothetical protein